MSIDADCHISARPAPGQLGADDLVRLLDATGVDRAVAWPMVSYTREMAGDNRAIYEGARAHPDRIIPFGGVNPRLGLQEAMTELRRCIQEYGMRGIKLNGARDGYAIDDPRLSLPLVDSIAEAGLVLAFHCGANDFERTHPFRITKVSQRHPDLPVLIVHMGGSGQPSLHDAVIEFAAQHPTWTLVDSEADYRKTLEAIRVLGPERVAYGSDCPFTPMRTEWAIRQAVYQDMTEAERALILGGNVARVLRLA